MKNLKEIIARLTILILFSCKTNDVKPKENKSSQNEIKEEETGKKDLVKDLQKKNSINKKEYEVISQPNEDKTKKDQNLSQNINKTKSSKKGSEVIELLNKNENPSPKQQIKSPKTEIKTKPNTTTKITPTIKTENESKNKNEVENKNENKKQNNNNNNLTKTKNITRILQIETIDIEKEEKTYNNLPQEYLDVVNILNHPDSEITDIQNSLVEKIINENLKALEDNQNNNLDKEKIEFLIRLCIKAKETHPAEANLSRLEQVNNLFDKLIALIFKNKVDDISNFLTKNSAHLLLFYITKNWNSEIFEQIIKHKEINVNIQKNELPLLFWLINPPSINKSGKYIIDEKILENNKVTVTQEKINTLSKFLDNPKLDINKKTSDDKFTPLIWAAEFDQSEIIELLLNYEELNINDKNENGQTALMIEMIKKNFVKKTNEEKERGYSKIKKYFNHKKFDINTQDNGLKSSFFYCLTKNNDFNLANLFLDNPNLDINQLNTRDNYSPLYIAIYTKQIKVIEKLLQKNDLDINLSDKSNTSPLMEAARKGRVEILKLLLNNSKININAVNNENKTALEICQKSKNDYTSLKAQQCFDECISLLKSKIQTN